MNRGLKEIYNQISDSSGLINYKLNLYNSDNNLFINIPLFNNNINLSLIYNHQNKDDLFDCGKGFKMNYYSKFLYNSSGNSTLEKTDRIINLESSSYTSITDESSYAIAGGIIGAASGALINAGTQVINNGFSDFSWSSVGLGVLSGMIDGAIAGGLFGGIQHVLTTTKIAQAVSNLNQAEGQLSRSLKLFANVNSFNGTPFSGANIANALGTALGNYQNAYNSYIAARATYSFVNGLAKISYFGLENVTSNLIGLWF